jgi:hypothetical protein
LQQLLSDACLPIIAPARESLVQRSQRFRDLERVCLRKRRQTMEVVDEELPAQSGSRESAKTTIECLKRSGGSSFVAVMKTADLRQSVYRPKCWSLNCSWLRSVFG